MAVVTKGPVYAVFTQRKKKNKTKQKYRMWQIKQEMCMSSEIVKCCVHIRGSYSLLL